MDAGPPTAPARGGRTRLLAAVALVAALGAAAGAYFGLRGHPGTAAGSGIGPSPRANAAMAYDASKQTIVLFGGSDAKGQPLGDTWTWDGASWTQRHPTHSPQPRSAAAMAYDSGTHDVLLVGGTGGGTTWNWSWSSQFTISSGSGSAGSATAAPPATTAPQPIAPPPSAPRQFNDTWLWDGSDWRSAGGLPSGTEANYGFGANMATDERSGEVLLVASSSTVGYACPQVTGGAPPACLGLPHVVTQYDAWRWTGSGWQRLASNPPNTGGDGFAGFAKLVSDPAGGLDYFGAGGGCAGWSGYAPAAGGAPMPCRGIASVPPAPPATIRPSPKPTVPPAEPVPAPAPQHSPILLPGGPLATPPPGSPCCPGSVTTWDGSRWGNPREYLFGPSLVPAVFAPDPAHSVIIALAPGATWKWNGSAWTRVAGVTGPGAIDSGAAMAFDAADRKLIEFGGLQHRPESPALTLGTTWAWDGSTWQRA